MGSMPNTRASLLLRLRDPADSEAWRQFVEIYAPVVYGFARQRGAQDADGADLTQEVLHTVAATARKFDYDPKRGSFRGWLFTVTRNKLRDWRERQRRGQGVGGTTAHALLDQQPSRDDEELWDQEFRRRVFAIAAERVRPNSSQEPGRRSGKRPSRGTKARAVAESLGISIGAVYIAKSRVQACLKDRVRELSDEKSLDF